VKWLEDGRAVRHRILSTFEDAALVPDAARRRELLSFAIVGAGPVGVELAASMRDLMDHTLRGIYPDVDVRNEPTITLIDGADRVVPAMDPRLSAVAQRRLEQLRVRIMLRTLVSEVGERSLRTGDAMTLPANTVIWAGGVKTNPIVAAADLPHAKDGRLIVDTAFRVAGREDVLALGDAAHFEQAGKPLPMLAQVAVLEAPAAAEFARPVHFVLSGLPAWTVWRTNYLLQLVGGRNRGTLLVEWLLSYFSHRIVADIT
jgi:NADH dehydrogenase